MKSTILASATLLLGLSLFTTGCGDSSSSTATEVKPAISSDTSQITEDNAEAEAAKLLKEIENL